MLDHPLQDYFSYHPTQDPETLAIYTRINTELCSICQRLLYTSNYVEIDRIQADLAAFIEELKLSDMYKKWIALARDRAISAAKYQLVSSRESYILMHMQSVRMFCNQGVTMDRLHSEPSTLTPERFGK